MSLVGFIFAMLGRSTVLIGKLTAALPAAYARKRVAKRYFAAELRKQGLPNDVIEVMLASYHDMLSLNPLSYRKMTTDWRIER